MQLRDSGNPTANRQAFQDAIARRTDVQLIGGEYPVDDVLYVYGAARLRSDEGTLIRLVRRPSRDQFVNLGISEYGVLDAPWSGAMRGIGFSSDHDLYVGVSLHNVSRCLFKECVFDFTGARVNNGLKGLNQFRWTGAGSIRRHVTMRDCVIHCSHSSTFGGEGFGISDGSDLLIEDCEILGCRDDCPGVHFWERATIRRLKTKSVMGRIGFFNVVDGVAEDCECERIAGSDGKYVASGGLIFNIPDDNLAGLPRAVPRRGRIINCRLKLPAELPSYTFGIRCLGVQGMEIRGNAIHNDSPNGHAAIRIEPVIGRTEWEKLLTDDEGDPVGESWPRDHVVRDNVAGGNHPGAIGTTGYHRNLPGPFEVWDNIGPSFPNWPAHADLRNNIVRSADESKLRAVLEPELSALSERLIERWGT